MTVNELIEKLKEFPPDNPVVIWVQAYDRSFHLKELGCVDNIHEGNKTLLSEE